MLGSGRWGLFLVGVQFGTHLARCKVIYEVKVLNEATSWSPDPALWVLLGALLWKINFNPIIKTKSEKHICPCGPERGSTAFLRQVAPPKGLVLLRGRSACRTLIQGLGGHVLQEHAPLDTHTLRCLLPTARREPGGHAHPRSAVPAWSPARDWELPSAPHG